MMLTGVRIDRIQTPVMDSVRRLFDPAVHP